VLALFGPTAAGKSTLAHAAALAVGGEIVVADPFQRYRGLEIAADSPTDEQRAEVAYHLAGDLDVTRTSTAGDFGPRAHTAIDGIAAAGCVPIVAGGTGLYLRAALTDLDFPPDVPEQVRAEVERLVAADPDAAVQELRSEHPEAAERVDMQNPRRVARALELARSGATPARVDRLWDGSTRRPTLLVGVSRPREVLDRLIAERVRRELDDGLVAEIEAAVATPGFSRAAAQIIGVAEVLALHEGSVTVDELPGLLAKRTRRLARAQLTWLRKTPGVAELDLGEAPAQDALPRLLDIWAAGA
jgi:tRNA dimethylallyltransferase